MPRLPVLLFYLIFSLAFYSEAKAASDESHKIDITKYPYQDIADIFIENRELMLKGFAKANPEFVEEHLEPLTKYVYNESTPEDFVKFMIKREIDAFHKASTDTEYAKSEEFQKIYDVAIPVSQSMARMTLVNTRDAYVKLYIYENELVKELLEYAKDENEKQFALWAHYEVDWIAPEDREPLKGGIKMDDGKVLRFRTLNELPIYDHQEGDRVIYFFGGEFNNNTGRAGYFIIRDKKFYKIDLVMMN